MTQRVHFGPISSKLGDFFIQILSSYVLLESITILMVNKKLKVYEFKFLQVAIFNFRQ